MSSTKVTLNKSKKYNKSKLQSAVLLIFCRFSLAFLLGMLPIVIGLKSNSYVILVVIFGFIFNFGLATLQMLPYFKQILKYYR